MRGNPRGNSTKPTKRKAKGNKFQVKSSKLKVGGAKLLTLNLQLATWNLLFQSRLGGALVARGLFVGGGERPEPADGAFELVAVFPLQSIIALGEPARGGLRVDEARAGTAHVSEPAFPEPLLRVEHLAAKLFSRRGRAAHG